MIFLYSPSRGAYERAGQFSTSQRGKFQTRTGEETRSIRVTATETFNGFVAYKSAVHWPSILSPFFSTPTVWVSADSVDGVVERSDGMKNEGSIDVVRITGVAVSWPGHELPLTPSQFLTLKTVGDPIEALGASSLFCCSTPPQTHGRDPAFPQ